MRASWWHHVDPFWSSEIPSLRHAVKQSMLQSSTYVSSLERPHGYIRSFLHCSKTNESYINKQHITRLFAETMSKPSIWILLVHAHNAGCVLDPALVASNFLDRRSTTEIPLHRTPGCTNLQFRFNDQR